MSAQCNNCKSASHLLNGLYCNVMNQYVEHRNDALCMKTDLVSKAKCKQCIWKREMMFGIWCDLHRKDTKDIVKCKSFDGGKKL